ncbi:hypothetical protein EJB05_29125, partial [Eragrostis curvula]
MTATVSFPSMTSTTPRSGRLRWAGAAENIARRAKRRRRGGGEARRTRWGPRSRRGSIRGTIAADGRLDFGRMAAGVVGLRLCGGGVGLLSLPSSEPTRSTGRNRGPCATHGTGRRGHSTPREHEEAGSTRRGLRLRASAGPAVELLGSAELWVVQELAGTGTAVQVQPVLAGAELLEVPLELAGGELVVLAAAEVGEQTVLAAAELERQQVLAAAVPEGRLPQAGRH